MGTKEMGIRRPLGLVPLAGILGQLVGNHVMQIELLPVFLREAVLEQAECHPKNHAALHSDILLNFTTTIRAMQIITRTQLYRSLKSTR
jgi:hypothetical protein